MKKTKESLNNTHLLSPSLESTSTFSYLAKKTMFDGDIYTAHVLHIDSYYRGNIYSQNLLNIAKTAHVKGNIYAYRVLVSGIVQGNIYSLGRVYLYKNSIVVGNIYSLGLKMMNTAILHGYNETHNGYFLNSECMKQFSFDQKIQIRRRNK